jgi:hypothetical protein
LLLRKVLRPETYSREGSEEVVQWLQELQQQRLRVDRDPLERWIRTLGVEVRLRSSASELRRIIACAALHAGVG